MPVSDRSANPKIRVLITGAGGQIGQLVIEALADQYDFVLSDKRPLPHPTPLPFIQADIADADSVRRLCPGIDTILHLAADRRPDSPWEDLLPVNLVGVYNVFRAAQESGIRRIIFASSVQVLEGHPHGTAAPTAPLRPVNLYGASKAWGEALASVFSQQYGMSILCLRLGWVLAKDDSRLTAGHGDPAYVITEGDLVRFMASALAAPDSLRYGIFNGLSANRRLRMQTPENMVLPGYTPQEDAFALVKGPKARLIVGLRRLRQQLSTIVRGEL
jgi:nucleoside-diphosphate-sugar epimerase